MLKKIKTILHNIYTYNILVIVNWFKKAIKNMRVYSITEEKETPAFDRLYSAFEDLSKTLELPNIDFERTTKVFSEFEFAKFSGNRRLYRYSKTLRKFRFVFIIETAIIALLLSLLFSMTMYTQKLNNEIKELQYANYVDTCVYEAKIETLWEVLRDENIAYNENYIRTLKGVNYE